MPWRCTILELIAVMISCLNFTIGSQTKPQSSASAIIVAHFGSCPRAPSSSPPEPVPWLSGSNTAGGAPSSARWWAAFAMPLHDGGGCFTVLKRHTDGRAHLLAGSTRFE
eukprot:4930819-Prymnesium_polylepis.1